jgi:hypothetical protein
VAIRERLAAGGGSRSGRGAATGLGQPASEGREGQTAGDCAPV